MQTIDGLEADVLQQKKDTSTQAEAAAGAAKALTAAEKRLEAAAAEKTDLLQSMAGLQQQLAPYEGRVQAAVADIKVHLFILPRSRYGLLATFTRIM